jgi:hypothetical protein
MKTIPETRRDRLALVEDAGLSRVSAVSVLAGVLVAYGAFVVLAGATAGGLAAAGVDTNLSGQELRQAGVVGGLVMGALLLASYLFGGYVAGRMARRAGVTHGLLVFLFGVLIAVAVAAVVRESGATDRVVEGIKSLGVPTSADQWREIGTVAGIASMVGMLIGALLGGAWGEHWHDKLIARALNPNFGPERQAKLNAAKVNRARLRRMALLGRGRTTEPAGRREIVLPNEESDHERPERPLVAAGRQPPRKSRQSKPKESGKSAS